MWHAPNSDLGNEQPLDDVVEFDILVFQLVLVRLFDTYVDGANAKFREFARYTPSPIERLR